MLTLTKNFGTKIVLPLALFFFPLTWVHGKQVKLDVAMAQPTMLLCERPKCENHLRIALEGFEIESASKRLPVNIAIVIDRSGSMQGDKIKHAREAALQAIDRLKDNDIVSIVAYDTSVEVLVPATKAADREEIKTAYSQHQGERQHGSVRWREQRRRRSAQVPRR